MRVCVRVRAHRYALPGQVVHDQQEADAGTLIIPGLLARQASLPPSAQVPKGYTTRTLCSAANAALSGIDMPSSITFCRTRGSRRSLCVLGRRLAFCGDGHIKTSEPTA